MPFFSVIIPNYNHAAFLRHRIDSVLNQTYDNFEVIILDDHSSDNSVEVIKEYQNNPKISHILLNDQNSNSLLLQWKKGIELAKGDWIWIAESDDIADAAFLEECADHIQRHPTMGLWYCDSNVLYEKKQEIRNNISQRKNSIFKTGKWNTPYFQKGIDEINECLKYDCTVNNVSAAVFKKKLALAVLQQPMQLRYYADWYFFLQLCLAADISYSPRALNTYRHHPDSLLRGETSLLTSKKEYFEILKLLYYRDTITDKKGLLAHHSFNYLSFGIFKDGFANMIKIAKAYWMSDKKLAAKVFSKIFLIKLFYKRYKAKFELTDNPVPASQSF